MSERVAGPRSGRAEGSGCLSRRGHCAAQKDGWVSGARPLCLLPCELGRPRPDALRSPSSEPAGSGSRAPRPAPGAHHREGCFASALSPREKGREDANASRNVAVCLSVRPSPTSDLRGLPTIAHRREGKRRHANLQVTPRGTPLSLTPSSAGPLTPDKSIGHRITPRGLWWPLSGACPPCGRRRGPRVR